MVAKSHVVLATIVAVLIDYSFINANSPNDYPALNMLTSFSSNTLVSLGLGSSI